jgi:hypothetical protein
VSGELRQDRFDHPVGIGEGVIVPEAEHAVALLAEPGVPPPVMVRIGMLATVELHDQPFIAAAEVDRIDADRLLPDEFEPAELAIAQPTPDAPFRVGGIPPKPAREACRSLVRSRILPPPLNPRPLTLPSPRKRGEGAYVPANSM